MKKTVECCSSVVLKLEGASESSGSLLKQITGHPPPHPSVSNSDLVWGLSICFSSRFPGDTDGIDRGCILRTPFCKVRKVVEIISTGNQGVLPREGDN